MADYSFSDLLRITTATKSQLTWWINQGVIVPSGGPLQGTGNHGRHPFVNLLFVEICVELSRHGYNVNGMRPVVNRVGLLISNTPTGGNPVEARDETLRLAKLYPRGHEVISAGLGTTTPEATAANIMMWKSVADPEYRKKLGFGGIVLHAHASIPNAIGFGFLAQPRDAVNWIDWDEIGRSAAFVNFIPILNDLEAKTGERL